MTGDDRIFEMRKACLAYAEQVGNVSEACRVFGISRTTFYEWKRRADRYGIDGLRPRARRRPAQPNQTPVWQVEIVLAEAISRPTLGARRLVEYCEDRGVELSASGIQKILRRHNLGRRAQRVAMLAQLTAVTDGVATREAVEGEFGFCHFAAFPGDLVALDAFYVGKLKGVGKVWQFTAVDTATRAAVVDLVVDNHTAEAAAAFIDLAIERFAEMAVEVAGVLTDRGPEFVGRPFQDYLAERDIQHTKTPPRSPNHNAVCERFHGTVLHEFYRPTFHRQFITRLDRLDAELQSWVHRYNTRRRNHGDYMQGRTPKEVIDQRLEQFQQAA